MLRQGFARSAATALRNGKAFNTTRSFSVTASRKAEVEITIDGKKVMIEQVGRLRGEGYGYGLTVILRVQL